jgi:hypothetical protein
MICAIDATLADRVNISQCYWNDDVVDITL